MNKRLKFAALAVAAILVAGTANAQFPRCVQQFPQQRMVPRITYEPQQLQGVQTVPVRRPGARLVRAWRGFWAPPIVYQQVPIYGPVQQAPQQGAAQ